MLSDKQERDLVIAILLGFMTDIILAGVILFFIWLL
jgi:hypothetical protein